ncbi:hypothetical protein [Nocardiopsis sp. HUAS JQ3]|uniref:hypothetical protein n=1 Tax=Nocardiopsis sp. HUAS JQ3 TaxID=3061629 RepID=UPI0023A98025|nr:hypothetical protein [Nocardiopsis sp. HUAS JQ3]WDZ89942.1 hypothetical protein PV789_23985 [Nocardiopsis sp. HUAS JQ3]
MVRPRHPNKDLESALRAAEARQWRVERRKKYYKMYCPCPEKHFKTVKLTLSGANHLKDLLGQLRRATCWEERDL